MKISRAIWESQMYVNKFLFNVVWSIYIAPLLHHFEWFKPINNINRYVNTNFKNFN